MPFTVDEVRGAGPVIRVHLRSDASPAEIGVALTRVTGIPVRAESMQVERGGVVLTLVGAAALLGASFFGGFKAACESAAPNPGGYALASMLASEPGLVDAAMVEAFAGKIGHYYSQIDRADRGDAAALDWVLSMFNEDAVYERAGVTYVGRAAIEKFYREERRVRFTHFLHEVEVIGTSVQVQGTYVGVNGQGKPSAGRFTDTWELGGLGIARRVTVLHDGATAENVR